MSNDTARTYVGMDLGDESHAFCIVDGKGEVQKVFKTENTWAAIRAAAAQWDCQTTVIAMEAGTHSPWISRRLKSLGFQVLVGNPRKLRAVWDSDFKTDERDAEILATIASFKPKLLFPIQHRGEEAQIDLLVLKSRDLLVRTRGALIVAIRGMLKSLGIRIPKCSTSSFVKTVKELELPRTIRQALNPQLELIELTTTRIGRCDALIAKLSQKKYPEVARLQQVNGVGPVTALSFVLTLESADRFEKCRDVGPYLGLVPKKDQSGTTDKQLSITKAGNTYMRRLLVGCANYILGPFAKDSDLRRHGLRIAGSGESVARRRKAKVAVARKLAVLLLSLWKSGQEYEPLRRTA